MMKSILAAGWLDGMVKPFAAPCATLHDQGASAASWPAEGQSWPSAWLPGFTLDEA
jgi:hypothetical protein